MNILTRPITPVLRAHLIEEFNTTIFIKDDVRALLESKELYTTIRCKNFTVHYIRIPKLTKKGMCTVVDRLIAVASIFEITKDITLWLLPCMRKRFFPKGAEYFNTKHINGGYTYINNGNIYIYRYEEFAKVALHELLHNSVLQTSDAITSAHVHALSNRFNLDTTVQGGVYGNGNFQKLLISEAIIEAWAVMFNVCFRSIETGVPVQKLYDAELAYAIAMSHKHLKYHERYHPILKEMTHAYAYIRLKTCILAHWSDFEKISYAPYQSDSLYNFFMMHNMSEAFLKKVRDAKLPAQKLKGCRLTIYG